MDPEPDGVATKATKRNEKEQSLSSTVLIRWVDGTGAVCDVSMVEEGGGGAAWRAFVQRRRSGKSRWSGRDGEETRERAAISCCLVKVGYV